MMRQTEYFLRDKSSFHPRQYPPIIIPNVRQLPPLAAVRALRGLEKSPKNRVLPTLARVVHSTTPDGRGAHLLVAHHDVRFVPFRRRG
jgi:hypothetical protein